MFPSIRSFLAFTYTVLVLLIIAMLGTGIQALVESRLRENLDADLRARADQISTFLTSDIDTDPTEQIDRLSAGLRMGGQGDVTYVRLYDANGLPVPPLTGPLPPMPEVPPEQLRSVRAETMSTVEAAEGSQMRVLTLPIMYRERPLAYLQLGRNLEPINRIATQLRNTLIAGGILAGALAAVVSYVLAYQALKPFSQIVDDTQHIGPDRLERRLPESYGVYEVSSLARSFNSLLDGLQRAFELQRRFVADASHELRTPLTTIRGNIEVLLLDPTLPPQLRDALQRVSAEAARLSRLVTNLLLLARADAGQAGPPRHSVDLHALVLETIHQARPLSDGVAIRLGREDQVTVAGDADQLKQVLLNLLDNALKFTPRGGQVWVSVYSDGPWAKLEVRDTGVGIPAADLERIFDRFYTAERSLHSPSGSGLGLSIVSWVVRSHGGRITVESQPGAGSLFTVWLPLLVTAHAVPA